MINTIGLPFRIKDMYLKILHFLGGWGLGSEQHQMNVHFVISNS